MANHPETPETKKEVNYWPYAIVGMILTVVMLGIWTIKVAVSNPVQESDAYMMKYQDVDENINEILAKQQAFFAKYDIDLSANKLHLGENRVVVAVSGKNDGAPVPDATIVGKVTRPTTNREDIELKNFVFRDGRYVSEPFELKRAGRWNIQVQVKIGPDVGYTTYKTFIPVPSGANQ